MPCNTVQTSQVVFNAQATDRKILSDALRALGFAVTENGEALSFAGPRGYGNFRTATGELTIASNSFDAAEIKRAYSEQVVTTQAKRFGWQLSWKVNASGNREATVVKRT